MIESNPAGGANPIPQHDPALEEEVLEEWRWVLEERGNGQFDAYAGQHVAVVNKTVLGSSRDPDLLRQHLAEKHQLNPGRIVTFYVDPW